MKPLVKLFYTLMLLCTVVEMSQAKTYYFSSSEGSDSYTEVEARNMNTPWQTAQKLQDFMSSLQPGDSVLFKCGDIFQGSLRIKVSGTENNPIIFSSYGVGDKPVISGFTYLQNWTNYEGNIFVADCPECLPNDNVFVIDSLPYALGRFPNSSKPNEGYNLFESHQGDTMITDNDLVASENFIGGEIVVRKNHWIIDRHKIKDQSSGTFIFEPEPQYPLVNNTGYFIQNHINTLDKFGEWYFNNENKKIYVYLGANSPDDFIFRSSVIDTLVNLQWKSNITFKNIVFEGANTLAMYIENTKNIKISHCDFRYTGTIVLSGYDFANSEITYNTFTYSLNNVLKTYKCANSSISNNYVSQTGLFEGMGQSKDGNHTAFTVYGNNISILNNIIDSTGFTPISFVGNKIQIQHNFITNYGLVKDDVGGIGTWTGAGNVSGTNNYISENIIINAIGAPNGAISYGEIQANGIYIDDNSSGVTISNNSIAHCSGTGIYLHNTQNIVCENNTLFNNSVALQLFHQYETCVDCEMHSNLLQKNIFFSLEYAPALVKISSYLNDTPNMFTSDKNIYATLSGHELCNVIKDPNGSLAYTLEDFKLVSNVENNGQYYEVSADGYTLMNEEPTIIPNGDYAANTNGTYAWSEIENYTTSFDNNSPLTSGAFKLSYKYISGQSKPVYVIANGNEVSNNNVYVLRFSSVCLKNNRSVGVYLRQSGAPYASITPVQYVKVGTSVNNYELLFEKPISEPTACIVFQVTENDSTLWFDNIELKKVDVIYPDLESYVRFLYNETTSVKTFLLQDTMYDVNQNEYVGSITLQPFMSKILIKKSAADLFARTSLMQEQNLVIIWPNPTNSFISIENLEKSLVKVYNLKGQMVLELAPQSNTIDVSMLPAGIYTITFTKNNTDYRAVFMKEE